MIRFTPADTKHPAYSSIEQLWLDSFPSSERRETQAQRYNADNNPQFQCYLIEDIEENQNTFIGFITVWDMKEFVYAEHLATSPSIRNKGYGKQIMEKLLDSFPGIIILEVERPTEEISKRRIGFYQRCGFKLCLKDYIQPPYVPGEQPLPLYLMFSGTDSIDDSFEKIRKTLYKTVYGVTE